MNEIPLSPLFQKGGGVARLGSPQAPRRGIFIREQFARRRSFYGMRLGLLFFFLVFFLPPLLLNIPPLI